MYYAILRSADLGGDMFVGGGLSCCRKQWRDRGLLETAKRVLLDSAVSICALTKREDSQSHPTILHHALKGSKTVNYWEVDK